MRRKPPFFACILAFFLLSGCASASSPVLTSTVPAASPSAPAAKSAPSPTPEPTPAPTPAPTPEPTPPPLVPYEFGTPLEEGEPVEDDSFFATAAFLGDSRTEGLQLFGGIAEGDYLWARGMTVFGVDSSQKPVSGHSGGMLETLGLKQYDNVYIMLGLNELGYVSDGYERGLGKMIDRVLEIQPDAVVYLQLMPPVNNAACRANGLGSYITNENVTRFNEAITRVAAEKKVVLLNVAEVYAGEDGQLPAELAADGCHFVIKAYARWADYLRTHTIDRERYFANRELALQDEPSAATACRLVFPAERVFTCAESYSPAEEPFLLSKDQVENGWVCYEKSLVPFSEELLEHPDASLLMWTGVHQYMLESWEITLNDGWVCYLYRGEMDHAAADFDPGGRGTLYSAMIGRPGDECVFCLTWQNYMETPFEEPLESFQEGEPGYVSLEDMRSFLSGITVEGS